MAKVIFFPLFLASLLFGVWVMWGLPPGRLTPDGAYAAKAAMIFGAAGLGISIACYGGRAYYVGLALMGLALWIGYNL